VRFEKFMEKTGAEDWGFRGTRHLMHFVDQAAEEDLPIHIFQTERKAKEVGRSRRLLLELTARCLKERLK
jgi:hypothetical protein